LDEANITTKKGEQERDEVGIGNQPALVILVFPPLVSFWPCAPQLLAAAAVAASLPASALGALAALPGLAALLACPCRE
jgi:hypothetical protein